MRRVVVTGLGAVTPLGLDVQSFWQALLAGRSGVDYITQFDASEFPVRIAAEVKGFDPENHMERRVARRTFRFGQIAVAAAQEALSSARLEITEANRDQIGVIIATSGGLFEVGEHQRILDERGPNRVDPLLVAKAGAHMGAARVGRLLGVRGPNTTVNSACASGCDALGHALNLIRLGQADVLLAGGTESIITPLGTAAMSRVGALSRRNDEPQRASRPFDADRDGFVLGEGAGILVLEAEEHALGRGASILAELAGAGWSFDATDDTAPNAEGQAQAIIRALRDAGVEATDVDYINAHGTSTELNDKTETATIKMVFGQGAYRIPISSNKSMIGHLAAAAGAVESVACVLTIREGVIPPTINYETPDPECDLDYVPNAARKANVNLCLCDAFGLGGQNSCLAFQRYQQ